jgi:serine/threonine protein kinase
VTIAAGQLIGKYEIVGFLGEGDRKRVFEARDTDLSRTVALAVFIPGDDPRTAAWEGRMMALFGDHQHIVSLYDRGVFEGEEYIVCQFMPGGELAGHCRKVWADGDQLAFSEVVRFGRSVCEGLEHVHEAGVIHQDVALKNVWLDAQGRANLGDFDSAISLDDPPSARPPLETAEGIRAPEQLSGEVGDARSDLFSLGALLYELATGIAPFRGHESDSRREDPPAPSTHRSDLPPSYDHLVMHLLARDPELRPQTARVVFDSLSTILDLTLASPPDVEALIASGESDVVEFKSSLVQPIGRRPMEPDDPRFREWLAAKRRDLELEVLLTMAAFFNSRAGGTLIVGVDDGGSTIGVEVDLEVFDDRRHQNLDHWGLHLHNLAADRLGAGVLTCYHLGFHQRDERTVAVIRCAPRPVPTLLRRKIGGQQVDELYIRGNATSQPLPLLAAHDYMNERWRSRE